MTATPAQTVKDKPVATVGTAATTAAAVIAYAVYRGWIGADLGALLLPVLVAVASAVVHALVSPYAKVRGVVERGLHISDVDFGRIEAVLEQYGLQLLLHQGTPPVPAAAEPAEPPPDGMGAGAANV